VTKDEITNNDSRKAAAEEQRDEPQDDEAPQLDSMVSKGRGIQPLKGSSIPWVCAKPPRRTKRDEKKKEGSKQ
jgi:hypothetical protein